MPYQEGPDQDALEQQLISLIESRLLDPVEILLAEEPTWPGGETGDQGVGESPGRGEGGDALDVLRARTRSQARLWAGQLLGADHRQAGYVLARLIGALYPSDKPFEPPPGWWQTPLGKVTGRRLGHPSVRAVSYAVAGTMLGITRQGVHDLITRGKLARHPDGGVTVESVRDRLSARYPGDGSSGAATSPTGDPRRSETKGTL